MITCKHCGHTWPYHGNNTYTTCPQCNYKVFIPNHINPQAIEQGKSRLTVKLETKEDRIRIVPWGDVHVGAPKEQCLWDKACDMLHYVLQHKNTYLLGMGDYMDCAQKMPWRRGPNVYVSSLSPMEQYQLILQALKPLAEQGKILGLHCGNHEMWIMENTGIQIIKLLADSLHVPFLGEGCETTVTVNHQKYLIYSQHGTSSAKLKHTKLGAAISQTKDIFADLFLYGHVHQIGVQKGGKRVGGRQRKCYYVLTGHFLDWEGSYAQAFGLDVCPAGCPQVKLFADRLDVHVSI